MKEATLREISVFFKVFDSKYLCQIIYGIIQT